MFYSSTTNKLVLSFCVATSMGFSTCFGSIPVDTNSASLPSDSTLVVPIEALNKNSQPTVIVQKEVILPKGYSYVSHELILDSAFPVEGVEQGTDWIAGPERTWSIYVKRVTDPKVPDHILLQASASPGRKNHEIGAHATLRVIVRKAQSAN